MPGITPASKNEKSLTNISDAGDITVDEATMTVDEADRPISSLGLPITKTAKNNKSLSNMAENL